MIRRGLTIGVPWLLSVAVLAVAAERSMAEQPLRVVVGIAPVASLVERLGSSDVAVDVLVRADQDPHTYEPTPRQVAALAEAKLLIVVGMPFEASLARRIGTNSGHLRVVDASRAIEKRMIDASESCCNHAGHAAHGHPAPDPHVWLAPASLKVLAKNIADALAEVDPSRAAAYRERLATLAADIDRRDAAIRALLEPARGETIYVYHPSLGYFCDAYGLRQKAIETGGKAPSPRQLRELIGQAKTDGVRVIFVQKQFDPRGARAVADAIGGRVVPIDPLAEDVLGNIETIAKAVVAARQN